MSRGFVRSAGHEGTARICGSRRPRLLTLLATTFLAVAVAGCGSATPLTRAQLVSHANALCTQLQTRVKQVGPAKTTQDLARLAHKLAGFEQQQLEAMRKLTPPASMTSDWKQMIEGAEEISEAAGSLSTDVQLKKTKAADEALKQVGNVEQRIKPIVERDGFISCKTLA